MCVFLATASFALGSLAWNIMTVADAAAVGALTVEAVARPLDCPEQKPPMQLPPNDPLELATTHFRFADVGLQQGSEVTGRVCR